MVAGTQSKYAAFLETLKTQGATGPPTEICVSGLTWRKATSGGREFDLFDVTARLKVGSMTLVLGPPGCGKTSLLKAIAGVFPTAPLHVSGSVAYNGIPTARLPSGELRHLVTFAGQKDEHIPTLTVHETLEFAHACRSYDGSTLNTADGTDAIIDMLGLTGCQHTLVGDDLVRGVSGGQRRRVTLGEMLTGRSPVLLLDEYTTGLDTTVATDITQKLRDMCMALQYTAVAALLQPPPEVFALFDNVLILTEGHLAYFGPATYAVDFFQSLGFQRPPNTDDADFLQEVTSMHGWAFKDPNMLRVPATAIEFHQAFKESSCVTKLHFPRPVEAVVADVHGLKVAPSSDEQPPPPSTPPSGAPQSCRHRRSSFQIVRRVFQRQFKLVSRDTKFNMIRFGQSIVMGSAIGSLFGKLGYDPPNVPSKIGLMFLTLLFTSVTTLANIAYTIQLRGVFQKQALFQLYPAWAYAAAESVIEMLCTAFQVFLFTVTTYWMCEFSPTNHGDQYGVYYAIIFLNSACVTQVFKCIAAFAPSAVSGLILGAAVCFILIIFSGFAIPGPSVPSYFVWLFNINPGSWAFWAVMLNEYQSSLPEYDTMHIKLPLRMGDYYVQLYGIPVESKYVGWAIVYLGGVYIGLAGLTAIGYRFVRYRKQYVSKARRQVDLVPSAVATKNASSTTTSFVPVTLTFQDLHYSIPKPKKWGGWRGGKQVGGSMDLLCGIHGQFVPGTMTALMGTSGAGKSTLLDVLAGRKNSGKIKGLMDMNGNALMRSVQKQFGYVEQFDLHCLTATVQEALEFSASLRLPASEDVTRIIQATLDILELHGDRGKRISDLSNEQSKRVTIGVELVANPSILFLDEPTSGLDVHAAKVVLDAILRIARSGRTVICTIHQPSFVLFAMFDALVLLRTGGNMVYVGPLNGGNAIVEYFEAIPGIRKCRDRENPASYMLDVMAANPRTDFSSIYKASALYADNERTIAAASAPTQLRMPARRRQSNYATQLYYLGLRTTRKYWRTREYSLGRVLITVFVAGIFGVLYRRGDGLQYTTQLQSQALLVFVGPLFMGIISVITGLPVVDAERMVFFRERASGMYATLPYAIVFALVEVPYVVMNSLVFSGLFYILVGLKATADAFTWFCGYYFLYNLFATYLGQLLVVILPDLRTAVMATGGLNSLMSLFAGFFIHKDNIPAAWSFMYWMSPLHYVLEGMMCTQYADNHASIALSSKGTILSRENTTVSAYVFEMFGGGLSADNNVPNVGFLGLCIAVVKISTFLAMKFVSFVTR